MFRQGQWWERVNQKQSPSNKLIRLQKYKCICQGRAISVMRKDQFFRYCKWYLKECVKFVWYSFVDRITKWKTCMNPHSSLTAVLPDFWLTIFHWLFSIWCIINIIDSEKQPEFFILKLENGESNVLIASEPKFHSKCLYHNTENGFFVTKRNAGWYKCRKEWLWFILPNKCED